MREEEDVMTKVEYSEQFQVQHLDPQVIAEVQGESPYIISHIEERKRNWVNLMV